MKIGVDGMGEVWSLAFDLNEVFGRLTKARVECAVARMSLEMPYTFWWNVNGVNGGHRDVEDEGAVGCMMIVLNGKMAFSLKAGGGGGWNCR